VDSPHRFTADGIGAVNLRQDRTGDRSRLGDHRAELFSEVACTTVIVSFLIANTIKTAIEIQAVTAGILAAIRLNSRNSRRDSLAAC
jgi:hypothetical protein